MKNFINSICETMGRTLGVYGGIVIGSFGVATILKTFDELVELKELAKTVEESK